MVNASKEFSDLSELAVYSGVSGGVSANWRAGVKSGVSSEAKLSGAELLRRVESGETVESLMVNLGMGRAAVQDLIVRARVDHLMQVDCQYIDSEEFHVAGAEALICGTEAPASPPQGRVRIPDGIPAYLAELYRVPLLTREQEQYFFRRMNFRKFQFCELRGQLQSGRARRRVLERLESLLGELTDLKNHLIRSNLRLVVSIAKKFVKQSEGFYELVSDGNVSLMRAVEKFDYRRGNKFSTYASWAILKNFTRTIPAEAQRLDRFRTGNDEVFSQSVENRRSFISDEQVNSLQKGVIRELLSELDGREQKVIAFRYGLGEGLEPETLEQVGWRLGVTKERVRQIEVRTLEKLRRIAERRAFEIPGI